jgi:hypothetical protein
MSKSGSTKGGGKSEVGRPKFEVGGLKSEKSNSDVKELTTQNTQPTTETMEVHHHPDLHHERKPWKEYLLEGLMIFLAVFMGFIAENIRERIVEKNRAKEYMKEMTHNLEFDTLRCGLNTNTNINLIKGIDSFRKELKQAIAGNINSNRLYYFFVRYGNKSLGHAVFNTSAITELRSSGSLRLIANQKLITDIADYYDRRLFAANSFLPADQIKEFGEISNATFSWVYYDDLMDVAGKMDAKFKVHYDYGKLLVMKPSPRLLKTSPEDLTQLYNTLCNLETGIKDYNFFLFYVKEAGVQLIGSIKNKYNLKDE